MDEQTVIDLNSLFQALTTDEEAGFQHFRRLFIDALNRRSFDDCQSLLALLDQIDSSRLHHGRRHYQAVLLSELRQYDQAEAILRDLLATTELSPQQRPATLLELGIQLDELGEWSEAESYYLQALDAFEVVADAALGQAITYNNLGISIRFQVEQDHADGQRLQEALSCHQAALDLLQTVDAPWEVARSWHGIGVVQGLMAHYSAAQRAFQKDLDLSQALDDEHAQSISLSDMAALVYGAQGQWDAAIAALDKAIQILEQANDDLHLAEALARQGNIFNQLGRHTEALACYDKALVHAESIRTRLTAPTAQASYRATVEAIYSAPISLHLHQGNAAQAFSATERARSRVLADLLADQEAHPHQIPADLLARRTALRQELEQAYADEEAPAWLLRLEETFAALEHQIELLDPAYANLARIAPLTTAEVCDRLAPDAALLTYAADAGDQLWVLVVTAAGVQMKPIKNVSVSFLRGYLAEHLDGIYQGSLVPDPRTSHLAPPQLVFQLYQALIAPVWDTLHAARTVYIVPFGPLHYIPLGALTPDMNTPPPLLAAGRRVVYAPSATILFTYCHSRPPSPQQGLLAIAPDDAQLAFTLDAAQAIARQDDDASLIGPAASREAFLAQAETYQTLCFLGHAIFDRRYPMSSRLKLSDGTLRASKLLRDLRLKADLVILSACETGRGQVLRGDEILGLGRALLYAGTPALLVTLWPVHEIPTCLLVKKLTEQQTASGDGDASFDPTSALAATQSWLRDLSFAEARALLLAWSRLSPPEIEAQLTRLWQMTHPDDSPQAGSQLFAHPFFWAPYILIGERQ